MNLDYSIYFTIIVYLISYILYFFSTLFILIHIYSYVLLYFLSVISHFILYIISYILSIIIAANSYKYYYSNSLLVLNIPSKIRDTTVSITIILFKKKKVINAIYYIDIKNSHSIFYIFYSQLIKYLPPD